MLIDTPATYKGLTSEYGFSEAQAEGIIETISSAEEQIATKEDIQQLRQASQQDITRLEAKIDEDITRLEAKIDEGITRLEAKIDTDIAALRATMWRVALGSVGTILAALAVCTAIIVAYG